MQNPKNIGCDQIMDISRARHRVDKATQILMLDVRDKLTGQVVLDGYVL